MNPPSLGKGGLLPQPLLKEFDQDCHPTNKGYNLDHQLVELRHQLDKLFYYPFCGIHRYHLLHSLMYKLYHKNGTLSRGFGKII